MTHNTTSGVAHFASNNEEECLADIRRLLSYLLRNLEEAPVFDSGDDPERQDESLNDIIPDNPNAPYDMKDIIKSC